MPIVATCCCGEKFVIAQGSFPRHIACHQCGSRSLVFGPDSIDSEKGWRIADEPLPSKVRDAALTASATACSICGRAGFAACAMCGRFYCAVHGRPRSNGRSTCVRCYDALRPGFFIRGIGALFGAAFFVWMPFKGPGAPVGDESRLPYLAMSLPMAAGFFLAGLLLLWQSRRQYP